MGETELTSPFGDDPVEEVPLSGAPLVRVMAQVRFPGLTALADGDAFDAFAKAVAGDYPILRNAHEVQVLISPGGVTPQPTTGLVRRLLSPDENWQVSVSETFLALDTGAYPSRDAFCSKLESILGIFNETVAPPAIERVGIRYVNRLSEQAHLDRLGTLVRREVLGGEAVVRPDGVDLVHSLSESLYSVGERSLHVRWGTLPAGAVLDPTIPGVPTRSWVLDLDSFVVARFEPEAKQLGNEARRLAEQAYRYFLWVVTADFLKTFGGA